MRSFQLTSLAFFLILLGFIAITKSSHAAFLVVDENGNLVWQVLSSKDDNDEQGRVEEPKREKQEIRFEVKTTNRGKGKETGQEVRIKTEEGKIKLRVGNPATSGETEMDVSELKEDIVRVKERVEDQELRIRVKKGRLEIRQKRIGALTNFPLSVNPETNELTVTTPSGTKVVSVLPDAAVANILQSNVMDRINAASNAATSQLRSPEPEEATEEDELEEELEQEVELVEEEGEPAFKIRGEKNVRFLNFVPLEVPVTALVSAQTGETLQIERPWFLNFFGFLFSQ